MASTFFGLNIGTTGIRAYQASLNTTAHNITNIGTKGYSKQTVSLIADKALSITGSYGMIGSGVAIAAITQERNVYFDDKYRYNNAILGNYQTKEYYLSCIESYLYTSDDSIGGITTSFDGFFNSLTNLTSEASDMTKRTDAVISSESFAQYVSEFANSLQKLQNEANTQVETVVAQINALGSSIASLTQQINAFEITGESANDLRDARNALLDELSQYVNIEVKEVPAGAGTGNGQFIVYIDGAMLVDSSTSYSLQCVAGGTSVNQNDIDGLYSIQWSNGQDFNMRSSTLGGSLQALLDFRDGNNEKNFTGTATSMVVDNGVTKVTLTDPSCTDLMSLNLPSTNGKIMIGNVEYAYDSFEVTIQADGTYSYEFALK